MKKVSIVTNFKTPEKASTARAAAEIFISCGAEVFMPVYAKESDEIAALHAGAQLRFVPNRELYEGPDILAVIGGDGSILEAVRNSAGSGVPILGINRGRLGYMAELELSELPLIGEISAGRYTVEKRSMIDVGVESAGRRVSTFTALNDAVVTNGSISRIIDLELYEGDGLVGTYRADGLIVSTPTGSTAYSLSAGGPILDPQLSAVCVTPVCAHSFAARPMVFPDSTVLRIVNVSTREPNVWLTVDGRTNVRIGRNDSVVITKSGSSASFIRVKKNRFYRLLAEKLESV